MTTNASPRTRHRHRSAPLGAAAIAPLALLQSFSAAQTPPLTSVPVATNLTSPVWAGAPRGDFDRLFILRQSGDIRILNLRTNTLQPTPYLTLTGIASGGERGLLGMAFHPDFAENGYFWLYYTVSDARRVVRFRADGDPLTATTARPDSAQMTLSIPGLTGIHNGGWIDIGPDGHLYIAVGDGSSALRARTLTNELRGKLLRIDIDGPDNIPGNADDDAFPDDPDRHYSIPVSNPFVGIDGDDEIWAYGLRNPWRNDIDPLTGNFYIADVGAGSWEEINFQPAGDPAALPGEVGYHGGRSYGWNCYEGNAGSGTACGEPPHLTFPFLVYGHTQLVPPTNATGCSITGGVVYRGCAIPELDGTYFFADYCRGRVYALRYDGVAVTDFTDTGIILGSLSSFGRDARGEVYICSGNSVRKIVPVTPPADINGDGLPDTCACPADWDGTGAVNSGDISAFLTTWLTAVTAGTTEADYNRDGTTNSGDISAFLTSWIATFSGGC